jgi:hypothetical protein
MNEELSRKSKKRKETSQKTTTGKELQKQVTEAKAATRKSRDSSFEAEGTHGSNLRLSSFCP